MTWNFFPATLSLSKFKGTNHVHWRSFATSKRQDCSKPPRLWCIKSSRPQILLFCLCTAVLIQNMHYFEKKSLGKYMWYFIWVGWAMPQKMYLWFLKKTLVQNLMYHRAIFLNWANAALILTKSLCWNIFLTSFIVLLLVASLPLLSPWPKFSSFFNGFVA